MTTSEPRALAAALQGPAFTTRGGAAALRAADRHVERWAPEQGAARMRPLRNLGFVDRLVTPWIESAQRSASMRVFTQYVSAGAPERSPNAVSWVMPRPWFQDELDWMAAARQAGPQSAPSMLTTRGTYVAPAQAMPAALHEYVAPSLSLARPELPVLGANAYSPLVPFAAAQAAHVMARAVAPITHSAAAMSPNLRAVLSTMLERTAASHEAVPTRASQYAPDLVTPPAPRPELADDATRMAEQFAAQHERLAELQRMARAAAERELAARQAAAAARSATELSDLRAAEARAIEQRQAELQRRLGDTARRPAEPSSDAAAAERRRIEERIAQRLAAMRQHEATRLHEQSREAAARDARAASVEPAAPTPVESATEPRVAEELAATIAALPPELAAMVGDSLGAQPERAVQAIAELGAALRTVELIARTSATGGSFESTRGPRVVMPAGLGGLVATVERTTHERAPIGMTARMPSLTFLEPRAAAAPTSALAATAAQVPAALDHVAWSDRWLARFAGARPQSLDVLAMSASPQTHLQGLAGSAPDAVFVAPIVDDRGGGVEVGFSGRRAQSELVGDVLPTLRGAVPEQPVVRFDDNAETPDDMLAAIAMAATRSRATAGAPTAPAPTTPALPAIDPERYRPRDTLADLVAHAAPSAPGAGLSAALASSPFASALRHVISLGTAPSFDVRALFGAGLASTYLTGLVSASTRELAIDTTREVAGFDMPVVAPRAAPDAFDEPLTTLRSGLLAAAAPVVPARVAGAPLARTMIESMALPMLADTTVHEQLGELATYAAPGMIAERAQAWSVAQERSSSDLAFDFVSPELVLAARVYGLGPAEAAQAARLAVAGPGLLGAMAGAVDRTFVQAMAIEAERRDERARMVTAFPVAVGDVSVAGGDASATAPAASPPATFGIARRAPRGAFLWPAATIAALGMNAASPDGEEALSLAALELLAAQAVAELGTYAALGPDRAARETTATDGGARRAEAPEADVVASASAMLPASRRDKFEALYLALGQSTTGRSASPAARAARALALAGRGDDSVSARDRATIAWDVLPVVYGGADRAGDEPMSTGDAAARELRRRDELREFAPAFVDGRPGLGSLSARAGEALGSYVAPASTPAASTSSSSREVGAVLRPPTAAPELVRTGGRHGGGEVAIPAWFEAAAKKMFEERSGTSSVADGISIAELTLIAAAPSPQIAASSREPAATVAPVAPSATPATAGEQPSAADIEKLANDVYREVLVLMDLARSRNGEPYL